MSETSGEKKQTSELRPPAPLQGRLAKLLGQQASSVSTTSTTQDDEEDSEQVTKKQLQQEVERLEQQVDQLNTKCASLEAQNILVSVQQLDWLARGLAWSISLAALYLYGRMTWSATRSVYDALSGAESSSAWWTWGCHLWVKLVLRGALLTLPYFYNERTHGSAHRRFQVFAIAFIVIARVRLCRWREQVFVTNNNPATKKPTEQEEEPSNRRIIPRYGETVTEDALWEANYEVSARFLYVSIVRLRGLWTKTAQYLSSRADFMPVSYVRELGRLQDEAPATAWSDVQGMLPPHFLHALTEIQEVPLASASIGQVHVARLVATGEKVVVKVQHPHAQALLLDDLWSLGVILRVVSWLEPDYEFLEILMREWAVEARKELDFTLEAQNLRDAQRALQGWSTDASVVYTRGTTTAEEPSLPFQVEVPKPYDHLCNAHVLVMTFCEGVRVDDFAQLQQWNLSTTAVLDGVAQAFAHCMYTTHIFNGDPHPGNLLVRPGTTLGSDHGFTLVLLDWGLAKRLTESKRVAFCELVYAAATLDYGLLLDSYKHVGLQMKRENASYSMENVRFFLRDMAPRHTARRRIKSKMRADEQHRNTLPSNQRVPMKSKAYPGEFFFFVRVNELLHGLGSKLGVDLAYLDLLRPYAERGLRQSKTLADNVEKQPIMALPMNLLDRSHLDQALQTKMSNLFRDLSEQELVVGAQFYALDRNGNTLANVAAGSLGGLKDDIAMTPHTLILGFSCTKAIAATLAHVMVAEGYLTYDEPLCERVWTAFCPTPEAPTELEAALTAHDDDMSVDEVRERWQWKRQISLWHVLTHQAGLWSALPAHLTVQMAGNCEACAAAYEYSAQSPADTLLPTYAPGIKSEYHALSFGWLVAGALCGAYARKQGLCYVSFEAVYKALLAPRLSDATKQCGFRPCGGSGGHLLATTVLSSDVSASKLLQRRRESRAVGDHEEKANGGNDNDDDDEQAKLWDRFKGYRGKEFLLDPRIWNCEDGLEANTPAAGGRFSAAGLAHFYHDLGAGRILDKAIVNDVSSLLIEDAGLGALQGATSARSSSNNGSIDDEQRTALGCGYQLLRFDGDVDDRNPSAFGHAGVGGSIGFHHKDSGLSVGLMLNKADGGKDLTIRILKAFADHFEL